MSKIRKSDGSSKKKRTPRRFRVYTALEKCQAVLAIWSERRTVSEICQEMSVSWGQLDQWQNKALEGMVKALETRRKEEKRPPLSDRLQKLLEKKGLKSPREKLDAKLQKRLVDIQASSPPDES